MRNIYLLLFSILCIPFLKAQFSESFESGIPATWTVINNADANTWVQGVPNDNTFMPVPAQDGAFVAKIVSDFVNGHDDYLITPAIAVTAGTNGFISFWARNADTAFVDLFDVKLSTTGTAETDFTTDIASNITPPTAWTKFEYNLNAYDGQTIYIAIKASTLVNNQELSIDLFENTSGPNCPDISNIAIDQNTGDTATLSWTNGSSETNWDVEFGISGFTPTGAPTTTANSNPFTFTGLTADTTYDFYIRANCGGDQSQWVGPFTFTTIVNYCAGSLFTDTGGDTGDYSANEAEDWLIAPINTGDRVRITFTEFNIENNFELLKVFDGPDNTFPALHPGNGFTGVTGTNTTIPTTLTSTHASGSLFFEFTSDGSVQRPGWVANVVCEPIPTCPDISGLTTISVTGTTADISWTPGAGQTEWSVEYGPVGFTQGTGTVINGITAANYQITGLTPITEYSFYIQGICTPTDYSVWAGPSDFETGCVTFMAPYTQDFENAGAIPSCWENIGAEEWEFADTGGFDHIGNNGTITGTTNSNNFFAWVDSSGAEPDAILLSPFIDTTPLTAPELRFYLLSDNEGDANSDLLVEVWDGAAWNVMNNYNQNTNGWAEQIISLSALTITGPVRVRFTFTEPTPGDFTDDIAIDDVKIDDAPTCPQPSNLTVTPLTSSEVQVSWDGGSETEWEIEYGPEGFTLGSGTIETGVTTNPYTITGLSESTSYAFYVRAVCTPTDISSSTGPAITITPCNTFVAPYTEGFENAGVIPDCWENVGAEEWEFADTGGFDHIGNDGVITGTTDTNNFFAWVDSSGTEPDAVLLSPFVDTSALTVPELSFYLLSHNEGDANSNLEVEVWDGAAWNSMGNYNQNTDGWEKQLIFLNTITITGPVRVRFTFTEPTPGDFTDDIAIDDVKIDEAPTCIQPTGLTVSNTTTDTADVSWTATAPEYEVVYVLAGDDPLVSGTIVTPNPTTESVTITGLNHSTAYEFYVTAICSSTDSSLQTGPKDFMTQLPNDECDTNILLTSSPIGGACTTAVAGTVTGASDSGIAGCEGVADDDVWYSFVATSNRHNVSISNITGTGTDLVTEIFEGPDCANLTTLFCSNPNIANLENLTIGDTYYVRVYSFAGTPEEINFDICITALAPIAENDACSDAIDASPLPYTNNQSEYASTNNDGFIANCAGGTNDGVWYTVTGNGENITVEVTPSNGYNAEVGVYDTPCGDANPNAVACASSAGTDGMESLTFASVSGTVYYINIGAISGSFNFPEGDFDVEIFTETTNVEDIISEDFSSILYPNPTNGTLNYSGDKVIDSVVAYDLNGALVTKKISISDDTVNITNFINGMYILQVKFEDDSVENFKVIKK